MPPACAGAGTPSAYQRPNHPLPPRLRCPPRPSPQPNVTAFDRVGTSTLGGAAAAAGAAAVAALQGAAPAWLPQGRWSGDGTAYSEAVANTGKGFACSCRYLNDWASRSFAAINKPMVGAGGVGWLGGWWWVGAVAEAGSWRCDMQQHLPAGVCPQHAHSPLSTSLPCSPAPAPTSAVGRGPRVRALHHRLVRGRAVRHAQQAGAGAGGGPVPRVQGG